VETLINEVLLNAFRNDGVREHLGFKHVSQVVSDNGFPGWYLWFRDMSGAFSLEIPEMDEIPAGDDDTGIPGVTGKNREDVRLAIRYFPDTEEDVFDSFSWYEQIVRCGPDFDDMGVPVFKGRRAVKDDYFVVGHMSVSRNGSAGVVDFSCQAPERWQVYRSDGLELADSNGTVVQVLSPGQRDRNVPGWNLSRYCFDRIVSAYSFLVCRPPSTVGASLGPSVRYMIDSTDTVNVEKGRELNFFSLLVSFRQGDRVHDAERRLIRQGGMIVGLWDDVRTVPPDWSNPLWLDISEHSCRHDEGLLCNCFRDH
jgi:hypothetical protein